MVMSLSSENFSHIFTAITGEGKKAVAIKHRRIVSYCAHRELLGGNCANNHTVINIGWLHLIYVGLNHCPTFVSRYQVATLCSESLFGEMKKIFLTRLAITTERPAIISILSSVTDKKVYTMGMEPVLLAIHRGTDRGWWGCLKKWWQWWWWRRRWWWW